MQLQKSIENTCNDAKRWYEDTAHTLSRKEFEQAGSLSGLDNKEGAVYVYFKKDKALYVGETGGGVKERTHFQTSRHTDTEWWEQWTRMQFLSVTNRTDRLLLELLLILGLTPKYNQKPGARAFNQLFTAK